MVGVDGKKSKVYNLEERTANFAEKIIEFCKSISQNPITIPLINQIIKSGTSQAANYYEANEAESPKDFAHKVNIAKKEVKETKLWLRLIADAHEPAKENARVLWKEAHELNLIFASIVSKTKSNLKIENS